MGLEIGMPLIFRATASGLIAKRFSGELVPSGRTIVVIACPVVFSGTAGFFVKVGHGHAVCRFAIRLGPVFLVGGCVSCNCTAIEAPRGDKSQSYSGRRRFSVAR
jgi:hypothetical protein